MFNLAYIKYFNRPTAFSVLQEHHLKCGQNLICYQLLFRKK